MKNRNAIWGIFFILLAGLVVASQLGSFETFGVLTVIATTILVIIIVFSIVHKSASGVFIPLAIVYAIFERILNLPHISIWLLLLAAVLLSIGFELIFRSGKRRCEPHHSINEFSKTYEGGDSNYPNVNVSFAEATKYMHSKSIERGEFTVSFGALRVYFDDAEINPNGAELIVDCRFGALTLFIPKKWNVSEKIQVFMGDVKNDTRGNEILDTLPNLTITGNVNMGEIQIIRI